METAKAALPEKYPFLQIIADKKKIEDGRVLIRGDRNNPGDVAPRRFLAILSPEERKPFTQGQRPAGTGGSDRRAQTIR